MKQPRKAFRCKVMLFRNTKQGTEALLFPSISKISHEIDRYYENFINLYQKSALIVVSDKIKDYICEKLYYKQ